MGVPYYPPTTLLLPLVCPGSLLRKTGAGHQAELATHPGAPPVRWPRGAEGGFQKNLQPCAAESGPTKIATLLMSIACRIFSYIWTSRSSCQFHLRRPFSAKEGPGLSQKPKGLSPQ